MTLHLSGSSRSSGGHWSTSAVCTAKLLGGRTSTASLNGWILPGNTTWGGPIPQASNGCSRKSGRAAAGCRQTCLIPTPIQRDATGSPERPASPIGTPRQVLSPGDQGIPHRTRHSSECGRSPKLPRDAVRVSSGQLFLAPVFIRSGHKRSAYLPLIRDRDALVGPPGMGPTGVALKNGKPI
jgi:hypothetical protein